MRIVIGDKTREFMSLLGISEYPFSSKELSEKFRIAIKAVHPDNSDGHQDNTKARHVIEAYKCLKNLAVDQDGASKEFYQEEAEKDLFELTEICPECKGRRTEILQEYAGPCPDCSGRLGSLYDFFRVSRGLGYSKVECRKCGGTGKYFDRVCFNCQGTGRVKIRCKTCKGDGYVSRRAKILPCRRCDGRGKIVLNPFNPVIPKGAVLV